MVRFLRKFKRKLYRELYRMFRFCLVVVLLVSSISFTSNAGGEHKLPQGSEFYLNYAEPSVGENMGYVNILWWNGSEYYVTTYVWNQFAATEFNELCPVMLSLGVGYHYLYFGKAGVLDSIDAYRLNLFVFDRDGNFKPVFYEDGVCEFSTGDQIIAYKAYGNVTNFQLSTSFNNNYEFSVYYSDDGSSDLLMDIVNYIIAGLDQDNTIHNSILDILFSVDGLENQLSSVINYLNSIKTELEDIGITLDEINSKYDQLLQYEKNKYTLLTNMKNKVDSIAAAISAIKTSIDKFFKSQNSTDLKEQEFNNNINNSSSQLSNLNSQNQVTKVDASSATGNVDSNIDFNAMSSYGVVLSSITNHQSIVPYLLVIFAVALVAYVLFGKKG